MLLPVFFLRSNAAAMQILKQKHHLSVTKNAVRVEKVTVRVGYKTGCFTKAQVVKNL